MTILEQFTARKQMTTMRLEIGFADLMFHNWTHGSYCDEQMQRVVDTFRVAFLEADTEEKEEIVSYVYVPRTWRDAVKERWFPNWLLKWYPVDYRTIQTVVVKTIIRRNCPHIKVPEQDQHLSFLVGRADHVRAEKRLPWFDPRNRPWDGLHRETSGPSSRDKV